MMTRPKRGSTFPTRSRTSRRTRRTPLRAPRLPALPLPYPRFRLGSSPTRRDTKLRRAAALGSAVTWVVALLVQAGLRAGFAANAGFVMAQVALWSLVLAFALSLAMAPGRHGLGADLRWTARPRCWLHSVSCCSRLVWLRPDLRGASVKWEPLAPLSNCFTYASLVAVPVTFLAAWSAQEGVPRGGGVARGRHGGGLRIGSSALVLTLHCASPLGGQSPSAMGSRSLCRRVLGAILSEGGGALSAPAAGAARPRRSGDGFAPRARSALSCPMFANRGAHER